MLTKKQKKSLTLIIISIILFIICKFLPFESFGKYHKLIEIGCFFVPYIICGFGILKKAFFGIFEGSIFDENFLMAVATIGALCLGFFEGEHHGGHAHGGAEEAAMVVILYRIGTLFESIAAERSRKSIKALTEIMPDFANVKREDQILTVDPSEVLVNEVIVIKAGEKIPLDGKVINGQSAIDTSSLTGESVPLELGMGDVIISGSVNLTSPLRIRVTKEFD